MEGTGGVRRDENPLGAASFEFKRTMTNAARCAFCSQPQVLTVKRALEGMRQSARMSGTPLGAYESGLMGGPSSSGSSRGGTYHPPPPPGAGVPPMRTGSYSSSTQPLSGPRGSGRGGSGSASPMHGGHRYSSHHGMMGSPGSGGDPFLGPGPIMMGPGGPGPMGYYMGADPSAVAMYGHGMVPGPGPLHGWPMHGAFGPGPSTHSHRGSHHQQHQQQMGFGSSSSWSGSQQQQQQQRGSGSRGSYPGPRNGGGQGGTSGHAHPGTPSPVPPTPGVAPDTRSAALSPGIGGGAVTAAAALAGATSGSTEAAAAGHGSSGTGSSSLYQHSSSMGSSSMRQRPSDAGSTAEPSH